MKNIKSFNIFVNEGLRDKMTPKSEEEIKKSFEHITDAKEMMIKGIEYSRTWLVQKALDRDIWIGEYVRIYHSFKRECHSYLEYATSIGNLEIVKLLMDNGAGEYGKDVDAAVEIAQREGRFDILRILLPYRPWDEIENRHNKLMKNR
jgi:ankyrin repeat protein